MRVWTQEQVQHLRGCRECWRRVARCEEAARAPWSLDPLWEGTPPPPDDCPDPDDAHDPRMDSPRWRAWLRSTHNAWLREMIEWLESTDGMEAGVSGGEGVYWPLRSIVCGLQGEGDRGLAILVREGPWVPFLKTHAPRRAEPDSRLDLPAMVAIAAEVTRGRPMTWPRPVFRVERASISASKRFEVLSRDRFACVYCGAPAKTAELVVDHFYPVSRGGASDLANLRTACVACNSGKSDRVVEMEGADG